MDNDQRRSPAWRRAAPFVAAVVGLSLAYAVKPGPVKATLTTPAALLRVGLLVVGFVALSRLMRRFVPNGLVRYGVLAVPTVLVLALIVAPYFRDTTVEEGFPVAVASGPSTSAPEPDPASVTTGAPATTVPAEPVRLSTGSFRGINHRAAGTAAVYRLADGSTIVRFEEVDIEPGPDYDVYIVPGRDQDRRSAGAVRLGDLKGNKGSHNYEIPRGTALSGDVTVLVWCEMFAVPIARASQTAV